MYTHGLHLFLPAGASFAGLMFASGVIKTNNVPTSAIKGFLFTSQKQRNGRPAETACPHELPTDNVLCQRHSVTSVRLHDLLVGFFFSEGGGYMFVGIVCVCLFVSLFVIYLAICASEIQ